MEASDDRALGRAGVVGNAALAKAAEDQVGVSATVPASTTTLSLCYYASPVGPYQGARITYGRTTKLSMMVKTPPPSGFSR